MSISELNVTGQPHYLVFTLLEYVSGLLLLVSSVLLLLTHPKQLVAVLVFVSIAATGLLTIYDAANPLDCNQYQDTMCLTREDAFPGSLAEINHQLESIMTAYISIISGFLISIFIYRMKHKAHLLRASIIILAIVMFSLSLLSYSDHMLADAVLQRLWNVAVSIDFFIAGYCLYMHKTKAITGSKPAFAKARI